jgi:hypothetical protein
MIYLLKKMPKIYLKVLHSLEKMIMPLQIIKRVYLKVKNDHYKKTIIQITIDVIASLRNSRIKVSNLMMRKLNSK